MPNSLIALVSIILNGHNIHEHLSQMRDGDLDDSFAHENQACPPALSQMGKMSLGKNSDLVRCLEDMIASPHVEVIILDGAANTNMLAPGGAKTFSEYATQGFLPYITSQLQHAIRVMPFGMNTCQTV